VIVSPETLPSHRQIDWKGELKKKLDERVEKKEVNDLPSKAAATGPPSEEVEAEPPPTLFKYKLDRALEKSETPSDVEARSKQKQDPTVFDETLVRRKPIRPVRPHPGQKTLRLQVTPPPVGKVEEEVTEETIPKEILFSRFLSGIVDLVLPTLMGFVFTIAASLLLGFDLFSAGSMKWIGLFALSFFFFNSLFFFLVSGQTPGMFVTDLRLVGDYEKDQVPTSAILLRVLLFLPSVLTVVGLLWSLFDPFCRCLHDLVSRTRIEPAS
jgi:uncharacterized RDD family membrane protein YckC